MSGIWTMSRTWSRICPIFTVHIPYIKSWWTVTVKTDHIPDITNIFSRTSLFMFRTSLSIIVHIPDITVLIPDIIFFFYCPCSGHQKLKSGTWITVLEYGIQFSLSGEYGQWCPGYGEKILVMASFHCPYSGYQILMSRIWPVFTGHIPDIDWSIFRTSRKGGVGYIFDTKNMF